MCLDRHNVKLLNQLYLLLLHILTKITRMHVHMRLPVRLLLHSNDIWVADGYLLLLLMKTSQMMEPLGLLKLLMLLLLFILLLLLLLNVLTKITRMHVHMRLPVRLLLHRMIFGLPQGFT